MRMDHNRFAVAALLAYAVFSILLIFLNKAVLSKVRQFHEPQTSHYPLSSQQYFGIGDSDVHFRERNKIAVFLDYDVFKLTFVQCAFTAIAVHTVLRLIGGRRVAPRPCFGIYELVTSTLFFAMLLSSNLCVKLIPVSVLPVSRSFTFVFVLLFQYLASMFVSQDASSVPNSLFSLRRSVVYALIVFGFVGAIEVQPETKAIDSDDLTVAGIGMGNPSATSDADSEDQITNETSIVTGFICGIFNSLVTALTSLAIKFTVRKRNDEIQQYCKTHCLHMRNGVKQKKSNCGCGRVASFALCYSMNLYATALSAALFIGYQLVSYSCGTSFLILPAALHNCELNRIHGTFHDMVHTVVNCLVDPAARASWFFATISRIDWQLVGLYILSSAISALVSLLNLAQIELCAPVTVQIANASKSVVMTLIAVACYDENHTSVWYAANLSTLVATLLYATGTPTPNSQATSLTEKNSVVATKNDSTGEAQSVVSGAKTREEMERAGNVSIANGASLMDQFTRKQLSQIASNCDCLATDAKAAVECTKHRSRSTSQQSQAESLKNGHLIVKTRH